MSDLDCAVLPKHVFMKLQDTGINNISLNILEDLKCSQNFEDEISKEWALCTSISVFFQKLKKRMQPKNNSKMQGIQLMGMLARLVVSLILTHTSVKISAFGH